MFLLQSIFGFGFRPNTTRIQFRLRIVISVHPYHLL